MTLAHDPDLDHEQLTQALARGAVLVDALPAESYAQAHIAGALSLPVADVEARAGEVLGSRQREIVVYCAGPT